MKKKTKILLVFALLLPISAPAENWTKEQQEVLAFAEACMTLKSADELMACFHDDYVGWAMFHVPLSKADRQKPFENAFANFDSEILLFKPLSVIVHGNMAVISYIVTDKSKDKVTEEVTYSTSRWTDVLVKDRNKWGYITDHGESLPSN